MMLISIIIPTLNEEKALPATLAALAHATPPFEVIVADGGSEDQTLAVAEAWGARHLQAPRGRAAQMNAGAAVAQGSTLLFLHADARLEPSALTALRRCLAAPEVEAGAFLLRTVYDPTATPRPWLRPLLPLADRRARRTRHPYGDQGLFVRASVFYALGGFPEIPLMEDLALSQRLARRAPIARCGPPIAASARRFQANPLRAATLMLILPRLFRLGVPPAWLARLYHHAR
ncbi:TIGR04283 family arsenosugar biosynthesis glycosyltransferase [Myxococcota bacterium]|nr:TIGR04283 family arsenosugar biosynthesis glycosyltransferase [Myxococcota bacterium]MBU1433068.1 TIGR04283 family arsenosugar biosynthesis glycosyltransferase [Myxococcota bacterium]MBU1896507.1 TIGR04283 family arsenosugar biosynthesis glycosyltransferase [Myxococcota bacterium]